jgi:hypothetical protein
MWVVLNKEEIALLDKQDPASSGDGGFQNMLVRFQKELRRGTSELRLSDDDKEQIARYAFDFKNGGWQNRLVGFRSHAGSWAWA